MKTNAGTLAAPMPYFGGKSGACELVWTLFGNPENYVEAFAGSAAMLLGRPHDPGVETINDFDGFIAGGSRAMNHFQAACKMASNLKRIKRQAVKREQQKAILRELLAGLRGGK